MEKKENVPKTAKPFYKKWWFWVIVVCLLGAVGSILPGDDKPSELSTGQTEPQAPSSSQDLTGTTETDLSETASEPEGTDFVLNVESLTDADVGPLDTGNLSLKFGELLSVNYGGDGVVVVKGKIDGQLTNNLTVKQNYFSVCDLIKNRGFDSCQELQYWAVATMTNGEEDKVISFTLDRTAIEGVANGNIVENQLGDYVTDFYIHPSLK